ncbi:MAG TPA: hypothetical protein VNA04_12945 [Thermoanaerobaculia bacterium]|nr:hypothetical protein [Thermoanaerobaculia bacterium]
MRCPECKAPNEPGSAACCGCGLILLNAAPKRRAEDYAGQKRRVADREVLPCPFCNGEIESKAIRCQHCSEIINDDYYRERARRVRGRVNYASWVAYLFGLGALLVFRPVGIVSIAAGLILSIVYYAIPVEPPPKPRQTRRGALGRFILGQLRLERVGIPIPTLRSKKLIFVGTPLVAALIGYSANIFLLQRPVDQVLAGNDAFRGMKVSAHYEYWIIPGVIVYDLKELSFRQTPIDVHTALLEFARTMRDKRYRRVDLSYRGARKLSIDGESFSRLGHEYENRNFEYVLYQFPRLAGTDAGEAGTALSDRDALLRFHREWYGDDPMTRTVAGGL